MKQVSASQKNVSVNEMEDLVQTIQTELDTLLISQKQNEAVLAQLQDLLTTTEQARKLDLLLRSLTKDQEKLTV